MADRYLNQWYEKYPDRYRFEVNAVYQTLHSLNPQEVQLPDGRRGFVMEFKIPDPEGNITDHGAHYQTYRVLMAWNSNHPSSASASFGGSVKTYFQSPSIAQIERAYHAHGRPHVPHLLYDRHPVTGSSIMIPCTQRQHNEDEHFTMVTAAALVNNWLCAMTAAKYRDAAYTAFCAE